MSSLTAEDVVVVVTLGLGLEFFFLSFGVLQGRFLVLNIAQTFLVIFEVVL